MTTEIETSNVLFYKHLRSTLPGRREPVLTSALLGLHGAFEVKEFEAVGELCFIVLVARRALSTALMQVTILMSNGFQKAKGLPVGYWDHWDLSALCAQKYSASTILSFCVGQGRSKFP